MSNKLKYLGHSIVFQEVPDEVTLAINISGCPHKCEGCHSKYLWEYEGGFISDDLEWLIEHYKGLITCVCFMGGDQNISELINLSFIIKQHNLKVALYSGADDDGIHFYSWCKWFDYVKVGHYDKTLGGLNQKTTNQKMYKHVDGEWEDITYRFWKEERQSGSN